VVQGINSLDDAKDELDDPVAESWSEFSKPVDVKSIFENIDTDLKEAKVIVRLKSFLLRNINNFAASAKELDKPWSVLEYKIETVDEIPICMKQYARSEFENNLLDSDVDVMQGAEIVEPSDSPYCSQCFYVWKKEPVVNVSEMISPDELL
jgi:hypothetical protein